MDRYMTRIFILLASSVWGVYTLEITNFTVPNFVRNGTDDSTELYCEYTFEPDDKLVMKWFHNDDNTAIYQWIEEYQRGEVSEKFQHIVSVSEENNGDYKHSRTLHLIKPTIQMSGIYRCEVTSFENDVSKEKEMVIYATPSSISINVSSVDDIVSIICTVENVFPLPKVEMFHTEPGQSEHHPVSNASFHYENDHGAYDVFLELKRSESELDSGLHFFGCHVSIEGANYDDTRRIPHHQIRHGYRPGLRRKIHSDDGMMNNNDPEVLRLDMNNYIGVGEAVGPQPEPDESNVDGEDNGDDGALDMRPAVLMILILAATLLMFW